MTNLKEFGRKLLWPNFNVLSGHLRGGTLSRGGVSLGLDLNPGPTEYEARVLTILPQRSVLGTLYASVHMYFNFLTP
jgi:hypothetical protein